MAVQEGGGGASRSPVTTGGRRRPQPSAVDRYLDSIRSDSDRSQDEDTGNSRLTAYAISEDMWDMWAAAAGLPGADYRDKTAANRVAAWAARALYDEFQNWGLVAIGWRYGAATARQVSKAFGTNLTSSVVNSIMGRGGAAFVNNVLDQMYANVPFPGEGQEFADYGPIMLPSGGAGSMEVLFENEKRPLPEEERGDPAQLALMGVLGAMADRVAGGRRLEIENIETAMVPAEDPGAAVETPPAPPAPVLPEDTQHMEAAVG